MEGGLLCDLQRDPADFRWRNVAQSIAGAARGRRFIVPETRVRSGGEEALLLVVVHADA